MLLTNKHFVIALIVAPILAIIAYFATDYVVSERPHQAIEGNSYPLAAKSNCRYASGRCSFKNGDVTLDLIPTLNDNALQLHLQSALPLEGAKLALTTADSETTPHAMEAISNDGREWQMTFRNQALENTRLLLVVSLDDSFYYGETETLFIQ